MLQLYSAPKRHLIPRRADASLGPARLRAPELRDALPSPLQQQIPNAPGPPAETVHGAGAVAGDALRQGPEALQRHGLQRATDPAVHG